MNVGHGHPHVMEAVRAQLERATHTSFQVVMYESYLRLAERLCEVAPLEGDKKAIFFSTGAEAVENAVKIARDLDRSEEHTSELQSHLNLVCRLLLEKK